MDHLYEAFLKLADKRRVFDYDTGSVGVLNKQEEPEHFRLDYFSVQSGSSDIANRLRELVCGEETKAETANGNGPVDHLPERSTASPATTVEGW